MYVYIYIYIYFKDTNVETILCCYLHRKLEGLAHDAACVKTRWNSDVFDLLHRNYVVTFIDHTGTSAVHAKRSSRWFVVWSRCCGTSMNLATP